MDRIVLALLAALAFVAAVPAAHAQDVVTACYKESGGTLKKFAVGEAPHKPCKVGKEEPISLVVAGVCGNLAVEAGEQCDDGNTADADGCSSACTFEAGACGDGNLGLSEQCDDGNTANGDGCSEQCLGESALLTIPFFVVLDANASTQTIATFDEFTMFARCLVNDAGQDRTRIIVTRTSAGWLTSNTGTTEQGADAEVTLLSRSATTNTASYGNSIDGTTVAANDGTYLSLDYETTALGVNVFGHRCFTAGVLHAMEGFIPEVPVP